MNICKSLANGIKPLFKPGAFLNELLGFITLMIVFLGIVIVCTYGCRVLVGTFEVHSYPAIIDALEEFDELESPISKVLEDDMVTYDEYNDILRQRNDLFEAKEKLRQEERKRKFLKRIGG